MAEAPPYAATSVDVVRLPGGRTEADAVAVEEPLEIRIAGEPLAVTMRTPGHDEELALGFCISEGIPATSAALPPDLAANTVDVEAPAFDRARVQRSFYTSSSCGVCGKGALEAVAVEAARVESGLTAPAELITELPGRLRQPAFEATGGLHATGLFDSAGVLVGGASSRFGSPKALARLGAETLAERTWRVLGEACAHRLAVGKGDEELPFPVLPDGATERAAIHGLAAGVRAAPTDLCVVLPVDVPLVTAALLLELAAACR